MGIERSLVHEFVNRAAALGWLRDACHDRPDWTISLFGFLSLTCCQEFLSSSCSSSC